MSPAVHQAVIMAAGLGTRLRPHTLTTPKPLLPVAGRPILEWNMDELPPEIDEIILVVGYLQENIRDHFGGAWRGRKITYVEQRELLGTGDALRVCRSYLDERFLVMNGDDLYDAADLAAMTGQRLAILAKYMERPGRFNTLRCTSDGRLIGMIAADPAAGAGLVNTGVYALDHRYFDYPLVPINNGKEFGLPQTLATMTKEHDIKVLPAHLWIPIADAGDLDAATTLLKSRSSKEIKT